MVKDGSKKLYRSKSDRVIAGVCAGIGQRLGISPLLVRLLFVLFFHAGFIIYIILWTFVSANPTQKAGKTSLLTQALIGILLLYLLFMTYGILLSYLPK